MQRAFAVTSAGIEGGRNLAESAQDLERTRKAINVQLAEFDGVKKSLMRDLQNRCEKVRPPCFARPIFVEVFSVRSSNLRYN
jgi:kinesin family member 5